MSKENANVNEVAVGLPTLGEVYGISRSIFELGGSVPSMKGKIVYALTKNEAILEKILTKADTDRGEMLKEHVKMNDDGTFKYVEHTEEEIEKGQQPVLDYKSDKHKEKAAKKIAELMEAVVDVEFHKIRMIDFENLDINPSRNMNIGMFINYIVTEEDNLKAL
jgi:hypothetical protein